MSKEMNRLKLVNLYSSNNIFDSITFYDGINLILGEKSEDDQNKRSGKKTNGVGKSMAIQFIDFCLFSDYDKSRISLIPEDILPKDEEIMLDIIIGEKPLTISRSRGHEKKPKILMDEAEILFDNLDLAKKYLEDLIFKNISASNAPSFRNLLSLLNRDERSEFKDILMCHDSKKRIPDDLTSHLFLLGISIEKYKALDGLNKEIKNLKKVISKNKKDLTNDGEIKISTIKAELNDLEGEIRLIDNALDSFKTTDAFDSLHDEIIKLESDLESYRKDIIILKSQLKKINNMPKAEKVSSKEVELVYNKFKKELGTQIKKNLEEVIIFSDKVQDFQRSILSKKAQEISSQINHLNTIIKRLDDEYSDKIKILDTQGIFKNLKSGLKIYEEKKSKLQKTMVLYDEYEKNNRLSKELDLLKAKTILELDDELNDNSNIIDGFLDTITDIHEFIMGNKECSFDLTTPENKKSTTPLNVTMRIRDDGSRSVNRTKVFIYDVALLIDDNTSNRHPGLLIHDNIFDVDQDTLVQSLNFLYNYEQINSSFQYILTLNRDKIENEERLQEIDFSVEDKKIASFTKNSKFLKTSYKEL